MNIMTRIKAGVVAGVAAVSATVVSLPSHAVLSAEETAVFTDITTKITDLAAPALTLLAFLLVTFIGFKLVKKFVNKAS